MTNKIQSEIQIKEISQKLLTDDCRKFLNALHFQFDPERKKLLEARRKKELALNAGANLDFLTETSQVRSSDWKVAKTPQDLNSRRIEITGPAEPKMIINALNSGANVFMADLEDALSPTWENILVGHHALSQAVRKNLSYQNEAGKKYELKNETATLIVRPRGLHLIEENYHIDIQTGSEPHRESICGSLFDFGVYFFHNAQELIRTGRTPAFYLPKLESHLEARWWNQVFVKAQDLLKVPQGTIRATVLIETILAAFEMDEILFELKDHAAGLNAGRWDYLFSLIKKHCHRSEFILPDRSQLTMATGFMSAYAKLLVQTCHRRGAHAIGGMAAFIPNRKEPQVTELALKKVSEDKAREAKLGFDGSWVAHPDLVAVAKKEFDAILGDKPNQKEVIPTGAVTAKDLLDLKIEGGKVTESGVRTNISVSLQYIERWLGGLGAVAINNLMEDAATAEISRTQLWQWLHHQSKLEDGRVFSRDLYLIWRADELKKIGDTQSSVNLERAMTILDDLVLQNDFTEFLTLKSYPRLLEPEKLFVNWSLPQTQKPTTV